MLDGSYEGNEEMMGLLRRWPWLRIALVLSGSSPLLSAEAELCSLVIDFALRVG